MKLVPRMPLLCLRVAVLELAAGALLISVVGLSASTAAAADKPHEAVLILQGTTGEPIRLTGGDLKKLPRTEVEAVDHGGNKARYSGVPLRVLLDKVGVPQGEKFRGKW